jgi:hypothetical protein
MDPHVRYQCLQPMARGKRMTRKLLEESSDSIWWLSVREKTRGWILGLNRPTPLLAPTWKTTGFPYSLSWCLRHDMTFTWPRQSNRLRFRGWISCTSLRFRMYPESRFAGPGRVPSLLRARSGTYTANSTSASGKHMKVQNTAVKAWATRCLDHS